ncbi:hypothetical protein ACFW6S_27865 [Streptomyces sp. NPDC058740]|uniref:hypothetical protein n=1 Tax=Streptomyces sp. NPDC058740 TaxID=3346619 RepID=UPI00368469A7
MSGYGGEARWNDETQSWEQGPAATPGSGPAPLLPPPPSYDPTVGPIPGPQPGPVPGSMPGPGTGPGRPRTAVVAGVVAAVLAAGAVGGWLTFGRGDDGKGTAGPPSTSVSATDSPSGSDSPSDGPSDSGGPSDSASPSDSSAPMDDMPPPGFHAVDDPAGFTVAVPENWNRTSSAEGVFYNSPDGKSLIQIFTLAEPDSTPYESLQRTSQNLTAKPGYEQIGLERTGEGDAAELVYAYDRTEGRRKVVDRAFTGTDGSQHAILVAGPESDWPKQRETLTTVLEFFRP